MLEFDVPELVDGAYLPENASPVGILEEIHQRPWQSVAKHKPYPDAFIRGPRSKEKAAHNPYQQPGPYSGKEPCRGPGPGPDLIHDRGGGHNATAPDPCTDLEPSERPGHDPGHRTEGSSRSAIP